MNSNDTDRSAGRQQMVNTKITDHRGFTLVEVAMMQLLKDTGESSFHTAPQGSSSWRSPQRDGQPVGLLLGDGDTPDGGLVDTFANHLIQNQPADVYHEGGAGEVWERYRTPADMLAGDHSSGVPGGLQFDGASGQGFNSEFAWRGPYLDAVRPDPWGNRYMANVLWLTMPQGADSSGFIRPVIVLSAGPDEEVDTYFDSVGGFVLGEDDIAYPVSYGSLR